MAASLAVTRLPHGVSTAPAIFQRKLELLRPVSQVSVYIDNIIIGGEDEADLLQALEDVLTLFEDAGLRLNRNKCQFLLTSVTYLGHDLNKDGIHPTADKLAAISDVKSQIM